MKASKQAPYGVKIGPKRIYLGRVERRVFQALATGRRFTGADLCEVCRATDHRGLLAALRRKGVPIADVWVQNPDTGNRCKKWFLVHEKLGS